jgi:hypothetical protein
MEAKNDIVTEKKPKKRISGRTLLRVAWPLEKIMEIDLYGGGMVQKHGR